MSVTIRPVSEDDVMPLVDLLLADREFQAPWHRARAEDYFTPEYQQRELAHDIAQFDSGAALPYMIFDDGHLIGRITVSNIVRGAFHSGDLGYWVRESHNGRGVATTAVAAIVDIAFETTHLHRLQAAILEHNIGSQRVLERNGFHPIGKAPKYLRIAGKWHDHLLFQRINDAFI